MRIPCEITVTPSSFTLSTVSTSFPWTISGSKTDGFLENVILNSLHLSGCNWTLFSSDHWMTRSTIFWALLTLPLGKSSDAVMSSTNLHQLICCPIGTWEAGFQIKVQWFQVNTNPLVRIANRGSPTQIPVPTLYFHVMLEKGEDENQARNRADRIFGIVKKKSKQYNKLRRFSTV